VVLAPEFLSHDQDQLTKELQQHVKSVTAPYKYPRKVRPLDSHVPCIWGRRPVIFLFSRMKIQPLIPNFFLTVPKKSPKTIQQLS
jgi:hypothetical protein